METLLSGAGYFIWPLGACSLLALFLVVERALAFRTDRVIPPAIIAAAMRGETAAADVGDDSAAARLVVRWRSGAAGEALKAFARAEVVRLQRGLHLLDSVVAASPLIGLLGTVAGLAAIFPSQGVPDQATLTRGVGLALSTTMIGLFIAIPSLIAANWLHRRLEVLSSRLEVLVESLESSRR
ncbi:MAG: MotA/TolQ/ExbB proton channel family protein [Opitutales bacterium]